MSAFLQKFDEEYDEKKISFGKFLQDIEEGLVTEADLSVMIGSLRKAFRENIFPDIVNDVVDPDNSLLEEMWINPEKQLEILQLFEYNVLKMLNRKMDFDPEDLISHIARQIISVRTLVCFFPFL